MTVMPDQSERLLILDEFTFDRKDKELLRVTPFLIHLAQHSLVHNFGRELKKWKLGQAVDQHMTTHRWIEEFRIECLQWRLEKRLKCGAGISTNPDRRNHTGLADEREKPIVDLLTSHAFYRNIQCKEKEDCLPLGDLMNTKVK